MMPVLSLVLAQAVGGVTSSGRPLECRDPAGRGANVWERAKSPELRKYCDLVASASSKLAGTAAMAQAALESARGADAVMPGHAAPLVLEGRALLALGRLEDGLRALERAKQREPAALDDPLALLAYGRALARTGHAPEAAEAYRSLLPRASPLSAAERTSAQVEAGLVAMSRGSAGLDEAVASLREAVRDAQDETQTVAVLGLAVALDRRGDLDEAHALLSERLHGDPRTSLASTRGREVLGVAPSESDALTALALEGTDPVGARDAWQAYLDGGQKGPWVAHARAHVVALGTRRASGTAAGVGAGARRPR
jgi:tetratricopeptide (TPR) repeat protein